MKSYITVKAVFSAIFLLPFFVQASDVDCENAMTTYAMNICAAREMENANIELAKYIAAVKEKYSSESGVVAALDKSQQAWLGYRESHCDAIYEIWSGGTIRGVMFGACMLQLTKQRTHNIWSDYLASMDPDPNPAMLPEPQ